ncbi:MAG: MarR family transcriptional regulator [bacterium]|nr:MarR family transcriptional regulator [bacterium]
MSQTRQQKLALKSYVRLMRCVDSVTTTLHKHLKNSRLTPSQFGVLEALYSLGPLCQRDLGQKLLKSGGNITMVIDNLEKRYLVKRIRDRLDRRKFIVQLTEEGQALIEKVFPVHAQMAEELFFVLSEDELEEFGRMLKTLGKSAASNESRKS